jgi:nicotinate-nucleotide pyrophosphorylase (carboxylating)
VNGIMDLIDMALREDIGCGDITTEALVAPEQTGSGTLVAKEDLVVAGLAVARQVFQRLDAAIEVSTAFQDGDRVAAGQTLMIVAGAMSALLMGERTALNFLQRLSGIATLVRTYVQAIGARPTRLVDTRKTTPGWRVLEKYAVRIGGAANHRMGLFDGVLIKDNHIAACGGIPQAIERIRRRGSHLLKVEVEVADLAQVREALAAGAEVIMLDNMDLERIREALAVIDGRAIVEVSGGVTIDCLASLADTGVDIISVGALTHSAKAVDISMHIQG